MSRNNTDFDEQASKLENNWQHFDSFGLAERENYIGWTIVYTHNRDSRLLDRVNARTIARAMTPFIDAGDAMPENHGHWACGWVAGWAIRVRDDAGNITQAFTVWCGLVQALENYPILDEDAYSAAEESAIQAMCDEQGLCYSDIPDNEFDRMRTLVNG